MIWEIIGNGISLIGFIFTGVAVISFIVGSIILIKRKIKKGSS